MSKQFIAIEHPKGIDKVRPHDIKGFSYPKEECKLPKIYLNDGTKYTTSVEQAESIEKQVEELSNEEA